MYRPITIYIHTHVLVICRYRYDFLEVREGSDDEAPLVGRYCGNTLPMEYISSGNEVYVRFKTDSSVSGTGFRIRYDLGKGCAVSL